MSGTGASGLQDNDSEVAQLLSLLWRRRLQIILVALLVTLAVTAVVTRLPDSYRAESILLFAPASASSGPTDDATPSEQPGDLRHLASEIERIRSRRLLLRVVQEADLLHDPAFNPILAHTPGPLERLGLRAPPAAEALQLSRQRTATLTTLRARLQVRPIGQSRALSLAVTAPDPESAARVANLIAEVYLDRARERARHDRAIATHWLDRRVAELRHRVQLAEAAVADFRIASGLAERGPESAAMQERIGELTRALAQAQVEAAAARARAERFSTLPPEAAPAQADADAPRPIGSQLIQDLRRQEADLKRKRAQLALRYGPRHPRLREANADLLDLRLLIDEETNRIAERLRQDADLAQDRADALQTELRKVNTATGALGRAEVKLGQLELEAAAERALFDTFLARLKETRVTADSPDRRAELITRAHPPDRPTAPNRPLLAGFGALTAVAVAVAVALLREALDRGVRTPEQLERLTGLRVLGSVPRVRRAPVGRVLAQPAGALAEALRGLHTALLLADVDRPPRSVLVTSALPGDGKTALACALARVLARAGQRVLLIDADLRYPDVARSLGLPEGPGLSDLLTRQCSLDAALHRDPAAELGGHLTVLPAGRPSEPGRLLESETLDALIADLAADYDLILVDAPPVLTVADPRRLAGRVDATVLAVHWARTPRQGLQRAVSQLQAAGAELAGAALVRVDPRHHARESSGYRSGFGRRRRYYAGA